MATYVLPQVEVFQAFTLNPAAAAHPLNAHIGGPHAFLRRYSDETERGDILLGYYDPNLATAYDWPARPAGGIVDDSYAKLWIKDALLRYFDDTELTKTAGFNNRVHSDTVSFADNGAYDRDASLLRDVQPGDVVKVRGFDIDSNPIVLWSYVRELIGDPVDASVGTASRDTSNVTTQGASTSVTQVSGDLNCATVTADGSGYDGLALGDVNETYDLLVVGGSVNGDYATAELRVISGSGHDNVTSVNPAGTGVPTAIGTRGLFATLDIDSNAGCSASAVDEVVSANDLLVGQRFRITVHQAFTRPDATSGGTYTGPADTIYIATVSRGGLYSADPPPQITVTTTNGVDLAAPVAVTGTASAVALGTFGATIAFNSTGLRKGDRYYVTVTSESSGPMRTIVLGNNISTDIAGDSNVEVSLYIREPLLQVTQDRVGFAPLTNWDTSATQITVNDGIEATDASWATGGVPEPLPVFSESSKGYGLMYAEYRAWIADLAGTVGSIDDIGQIDGLISGALTPDNPLKWGVSQALQNSNGTAVKFTSVTNPDSLDSWAFMIGLLVGRNDVYNLVPLTRDRNVLDLYIAHCNAMSSPEEDLWRASWFNLAGVPKLPIVTPGSDVPGHLAATTTDGLVCLAVVEDDPQTTGTQYTIVRVTSGNADFLANGVHAGDTVRMLYTGDGFGNASYSEFVVDAISSEDELRLLAGPDAPISVASRIEVWRNLNADAEAAEIARQAGSFGSTRVVAVWPDTIESGDITMEGYFLACSLAGEASGVLPHQGLTRATLGGYSAVPRTTVRFNRDQLNTMAAAGAWIVTQDPNSGNIFTRHALTTGDQTTVVTREEMIRRNADSISFRFAETLAPFIGVKNIVPSVVIQVEDDVKNLILTLQTELKTNDLGGQLVAATIISLAQSLVLADHLILDVAATLPAPLNNVDVHLQITV